MPEPAQHADHARLLGGGELGEDARLLHRLGQPLIVHALDVDAREHVLGGDADGAAHVRRDAGRVAGQDLGRHAVGGKGTHGRGRALLGRIEEGEVADEHHAALVLGGKRARARRVVLAGHAQHAHSLVGERRAPLGDLSHELVGEREHLSVDLNRVAHGHDLLERALGHHARAAVRVAHDDGEAAAIEVEGQLVDAVVALRELLGGHGSAVRGGVDLVGPLCKRAVDDRIVDEVLHAGGEVAVEEGVAQHARVLAAVDVQVALEHDSVLGEGAGLVGAEHVDRAEVLDCVEALDDHVVMGKIDGALAQAGGHEHREHLGREAHRHREREEQCGYPVALRYAGGEKHHGEHDDHEAHEQLGRGADARVEGGLALAACERARRLAEHRAGARGHHDAARVAGDHGRAHEGEVGEVGERDVVNAGASVCEAGPLLHRLGLAGERRLAHKEVARGKDAQVGRHDVPGREMDDIADDDLVDGGLVAAVSVALDLGGGFDHLGQGLGGHRALLVLDKAQHSRDEHHDADDQRRGEVALGTRRKDPVREDRDERDEDEDVGEGVGEGREEAKRQRTMGGARHGVRAVELARGLDLVGGEALLAGAELAEELGAGSCGGVAQPVLLALARGAAAGLLGADVGIGRSVEEVAQRHGEPRNPGISKRPRR